MSDASPPTNHDIGFDVSPGTTYPSTFSTPLEFANPDGMLSGTLRGTQFVGSNTLQIDSTQNLITIKNSSAALNQTGVLRVGSVSQNYLGMAVNNGTVDTMFAGQDSSGATVIKIAKAGFDAKTATNDQLIFNSAQNVFKIITNSSATLAVNDPLVSGVTNTVTIAHGQTGIPAIIAYLNGTGSGYLAANTYYQMPYTLPVKVGTVYQAGIQFSYRVDSSNIYFDVSNYTSGDLPGIGVATFKYYLLQETAS